VQVNCDAGDDQKALVPKLKGQLEKMTEQEIKTLVESDVKSMEAMMTSAAERYMKEDLQLVAQVYKSIIEWVSTGMPKTFSALDKMDDKSKKSGLVGTGLAAEVYKMRAEREEKERAANPLKVTDTEEGLQKKFKEIGDKLLALDKMAVEGLKKKNMTYWSDMHQNLYDFMSEGFKSIDSDVKKLSTTAIRAKNLQVLVNDLSLLWSIENSFH